MENHERNSILCPNCRKLISADERRCPYCGTTNPGSWWKNTSLTRWFADADLLIKAVIWVNIGMYVVSLILNPRTFGFSFNPFSVLSPANDSLFLLGATGTIPIDRLHRWWTIVSANYLHGGILHLLFNMVALRQIAPLTAREYGGYRMFTIYTASGVIGFWVSYLAGVPFTIGASAAVCGLIGSVLYYGKSRGGIYGQILFKQIGGWAIGIFLFGLIVPSINNWGHGGGFVSGVILGVLLGYGERRRETLVHKLLAFGCLILTLVILGWAVVTGIYYLVTR